MTVGGSLEALCVAGDALADAFCAARVTVCEDQPPGLSTLAVDDLAETIVELEGETSALRGHLRAVVLGASAPTRDQALALVSLAQRALNDISDGLASRIGSPERRAEVERAVRRAGWGAWWAAAARGLTECDLPLRDFRDALFACWRELAEHGGGGDARGSRMSALPGAPAAELPLDVTAHADVSGQLVVRTLVKEPGGEQER